MSLPSKVETILIVDPDAASLQRLEELLRSAGYQVAESQSQAEGFRFVRDVGVDLLLLSADLSDIQCCDALAEVKGNSVTAGTRVVLLTQGTGAARARGLELGADEVLSLPWEPVELLARVRVQLRQKHVLDELREKTRIADEGREVAQTAFQALAVTEKMTRDAFSLERALKVGVAVLFGIAILIAGAFLVFSRRADKEARRVCSDCAARAQRAPAGAIGGGRPERGQFSEAGRPSTKTTASTAIGGVTAEDLGSRSG
jgi:DNA-binding response OmpR family regulator